MTKCFVIIFQDFSKAFTTALTLRLRKSVYVWPVPTNTIGLDAPTYQKKIQTETTTHFPVWKKGFLLLESETRVKLPRRIK